MDFNPNQIQTLTALAVLLAAGIDVGIAFLLRAPRETTDRD